MSHHQVSLTDRTERRLLFLASSYLGIFSLALTLAHAARLRSWQADYVWVHMSGLVIWISGVWMIHKALARLLPDRDPFIFPIAALLAGWGLLTIWRLSTWLGLRQSAWLGLIGLAAWLALRITPSQPGEVILPTLRRYKYIWLTSGLILTAATLILGTNPMGAGPRLWLGCCGIYLQPSEPLKLLLIVYLAAYLADWQALTTPPSRLFPLLTPTLVMTSLALLLLLVQRDLGTAAIFLALYAVIVFAGTGDLRILITSFLALILAAGIGYALFDVVSQRVNAWLNPWLDPSGHSFQIVQSLLAIANGGLVGRGPGMGSPGFVPIAQSDFIFSAISEESGLLGVLALLCLLAILVNRGLRMSMHSTDPFHRLLATGVVVHLAGQSILIMAGNLRLLPLTGVTLPFVSYGGSSLVVSSFEIACLLLISNREKGALIQEPERLKAQTRTALFFSASLLLGLASVALVTGWWSILRGPDLLTRTDNPRRTVADRYVKRGSLLDRHDRPLAESSGQPGDYLRTYKYPALGPILGYTHPVYGQAGLEASLDRNLRGLQGYPILTLWWEQLLYGYPPPGLDVRLSIDLDLQTKADLYFSGDPGALVLLNAQTGEILAISSSPGFDANQLDTTWESLVNDPNSPLFDRVGMGLYPPGTTLGAFLLATSDEQSSAILSETALQDCALPPSNSTLAALAASGCPAAIDQLAKSYGEQDLLALLESLGLFTSPPFPIETLSSTRPTGISDPLGYARGLPDVETGPRLMVSPLQMVLAAASLSNRGVLPSPRLVMAYESPASGWLTAPGEFGSNPALDANAAAETANALSVLGMPIWEVISSGMSEAQDIAGTQTGYSWYLGGTLAEWKGAPLAIVALLEDDDPLRVQGIGRGLLQSAMYP